MARKLLLMLTLCVAVAAGTSPRAIAVPPLPTQLPLPAVPGTAQDNAQRQLAIQQAQAQARMAASQAKIQATLDANQARLEGQVAAQEAAQLGQARRGMAPPAQLPVPPALAAWPLQEPLAGPIGTMRLISLTPRLGRYFGASRGVLVARAPAHGALRLQDGDVILSIGGRVPTSGSQAVRILTSYDPGEKIRLVILREHHRMEIVTLMPSLPTGR